MNGTFDKNYIIFKHAEILNFFLKNSKNFYFFGGSMFLGNVKKYFLLLVKLESSKLNNYFGRDPTPPHPTDVLLNYGIMLLLIYLFTFFEISTPIPHPKKKKHSHSYGGPPILACIKQGANIKFTLVLRDNLQWPANGLLLLVVINHHPY